MFNFNFNLNLNLLQRSKNSGNDRVRHLSASFFNLIQLNSLYLNW